MEANANKAIQFPAPLSVMYVPKSRLNQNVMARSRNMNTSFEIATAPQTADEILKASGAKMHKLAHSLE